MNSKNLALLSAILGFVGLFNAHAAALATIVALVSAFMARQE